METTEHVCENNFVLYGTIFSGPGKLGDFNWMCNQPEYVNALFIFNDNEEFHETCRAGGGNAIMRKYNKYNKNLEKPKSAGIPTGTLTSGGYTQLDAHVINVVDTALEEIRELIKKYNYDGIYYAVAPNGKLGTGLFDVGKDVIEYIDGKINSLTKNPVKVIKL